MIKKLLLLSLIFSLGTVLFGNEPDEAQYSIEIAEVMVEEVKNQESIIQEENSVKNTEENTIEYFEKNREEKTVETSGFSEGIKEENLEINKEENPELVSSENFQEEISEATIEVTVKEKKALTIPGSERPEVEKFRSMYLEGKGEKQLRDSVENAITYRLYVRHAIQEKNLPPELEYLPVVESNYKTSAKSKSGAIGLWQFMENSVKPFLELNDYVDERYDPWKSTDAALRKLSDNYNYFNDWLLAIGAYNCGIGAMAKALKKSPQKDFWYLAEHKLIPTQTALYVPKLLAIADLAINSEYYGISLPSHDEEFEVLFNEKHGLFDYVSVNKAYSLSQLAQEIRMDEELMKQLNPSYIKGFTHPSNESKIRLPLGMEQTAIAALKKIKPIDFPVKYKVVAGDSLWAIAKRHNTTVKAICELNGINENDILRIGKILYIPSK